MYNDYNNNRYNSERNDFYGNSNNNYRGYNPYEPPVNNGYSNNGRNNRKKGGRAWLIVLLIVLGVVVVATLSIGIYAAVTGGKAESNKPIEWDESVNEEVNKEDAADADDKTIASEGTSDKYSFDASTPAAGEMSPQAVAEKLIPSVVCIQNYQTVVYQNHADIFGNRLNLGETTEELKLYGEGSGIVITEDGFIATNAHVVGKADILKVILSDDTVHEAKLVGIDEDTDLAVIKIEAEGLVKADLGSAEEMKVGQYVMAVGNPGGLNFSSSVTLGIVSALNRELELVDSGYTMNMIQTDASINPGNSGGALVNLKGQVVGINSAKYVKSGYEGLGFAITIDEALPIIKDLMDYGKVTNRSLIGVSGTMLDEVTAKYYNLEEGFYVYSIENKNAGDLRNGDVITGIDGTKINARTNLKDVIKDKAPGTEIEVEFYRSSDKKTYTTKVILVERDAE